MVAFGYAARMELFLPGLHELGYIEGKNIAIEYRSADDKLDRLPALAGELVRLKVDVLVMESDRTEPARTLPGRSPSLWFWIPILLKWVGR